MLDGKFPVDLQTLTVSSSAVGLDSSKLWPNGVWRYQGAINDVLITVSDNDIRFRIDGPDPTSSVGHKIKADDGMALSRVESLTKLKMIAVSGDATVTITYFRSN